MCGAITTGSTQEPGTLHSRWVGVGVGVGGWVGVCGWVDGCVVVLLKN